MELKSTKSEIFKRTFNGSVILLSALVIILFYKTSVCSQNETFDNIDLISEPEVILIDSTDSTEKNETDFIENNMQKNVINELTVNKNLVNINSASVEELTELKGIGIRTAEKIVAYRNEFGKFEKPEELMRVKGIGKSKFSAIKDMIDI